MSLKNKYIKYQKKINNLKGGENKPEYKPEYEPDLQNITCLTNDQKKDFLDKINKYLDYTKE